MKRNETEQDLKLVWGTEIRILTNDPFWGKNGGKKVSREWLNEYLKLLSDIERMHDEFYRGWQGKNFAMKNQEKYSAYDEISKTPNWAGVNYKDLVSLLSNEYDVPNQIMRNIMRTAIDWSIDNKDVMYKEMQP